MWTRHREERWVLGGINTLQTWRCWKRQSKALFWDYEFLLEPITTWPLPGITRGCWSPFQVYPINLWREKEGNWEGSRKGEDEEHKSMRVGISDNLCNLGNWLHLFVKAFNVLSQFMPHTYKGYLAKPLPLFNLKWSAGSNPLFIHTLSKGRKLHVSSRGWREATCRKITARRATWTSHQQACINFVIK